MENSRVGVVFCAILVFIFSFIVAKSTFNENVINNEKKEEEVVITDNKNIEYASSLTYKNFISMLINNDALKDVSSVNIEVNDKKISTDETYVFKELGMLEIKISYMLNSSKHEDKVYWKVQDTIAPKIDGVKNIEISLGENLTYKDDIKAIDECDGEVEVHFEGDIDETKVGVYKVVATATDASGNKNSETFTITINKITTKTKTTTKTSTTKKTNSTTKKKDKTTTTKKTTTTQANDTSTKSGRLALAKKEAKNVIKNIIKPGMSDAEKAQAISTYLYLNVDKQLNQSNEAYKTNYGNEAYAALVMKIAACSGFCKAVTLLCDEAGLKSQHINANQWTHQWNKVYVDGEWQVLDAQLGYFGGTEHPYYGY